MEKSLGIIREFHTPHFTVRVDAIEDYDVDLSFDDTGEVRRKLESGEFQSFTVRAVVYLDGAELASDYLGGCIYADPAEFQDHRRCGAETRKLRAENPKAVCGSYFADMIKTVCSETRKHLRTMQSVKVRDTVTI